MEARELTRGIFDAILSAMFEKEPDKRDQAMRDMGGLILDTAEAHGLEGVGKTGQERDDQITQLCEHVLSDVWAVFKQ